MGKGEGRGGEGEGREKSGVVVCSAPSQGIGGNMVSVLLAVARVGAHAWCSYLPRVDPLGLLG